MLRLKLLSVPLLPLALCLASASAPAFGLGVIGSVGYETIKNKDFNPDGFVSAGLGGAALLQVNAFSLPLIAFPVGVGLRYSGLSFEKSLTLSGVTTKYESSLTATSAVVEAGVDLAAIPLILHLQATASYDYMLNGSSTSKATVTSGAGSGTVTNTDADIATMSRTGLNARALLSVFPLTAVGIEGSYHMGEISSKPTAGGTTTDSAFDGAAVRALVSIGF